MNDLVAYYVPLDRWIPCVNGRWRVDLPMSDKGMQYHLISQGFQVGDIKQFAANRAAHVVVHGVDRVANKPPLYQDDAGLFFANKWAESGVAPAPGDFPRIEYVLDFFTRKEKDPAKARTWLEHFLAYTVQNPGALPKIAIVFTSKPAGGKGFLGRTVMEILGPSNCAIVKQGELENKFNLRWIDTFFVLGDEVLSNDNAKDISQKLKILIDGYEQEAEGKNANQRAIKNKITWMFASNDSVSPVVLEKADRRYAVYTNTDEVTEDHKALLNSCFESDRYTLTEAFRAEIAGFAHYLHGIAVDTELISHPPESAGRTQIMSASMTSTDSFFDALKEEGVDAFINRMDSARGQLHWVNTRKLWDLGEDGIEIGALYAMYRVFCADTGQREVRRNKFGGYLRQRHTVSQPTVDGRRPRVVKLPRGLAHP